MAKSRAKKVKLRPILIAVTCTWDKSFFCKTISLFQAFRYWYSPTEAAEGSKSLLTTVRWEEGQLYFPVWNTDQSAILLRKNNPRASCEIWHLTLQLALGAIFPAFFCRLWASVNQPCDMIGGLKRTWRLNEGQVERNRQETSLLSADRMVFGTVNKFCTNGPKWKIVHLTGPNWTDGNLGCKGRAKNSEIPNSSSQRQAGSSTGSSRIAFLWYSFILRTYTFIHLYILESFKFEDRGQHWTYDHPGNTVTSVLRPYIFLKKKPSLRSNFFWPIGDHGCLPFTKRFRKIRLKSK